MTEHSNPQDPKTLSRFSEGTKPGADPSVLWSDPDAASSAQPPKETGPHQSPMPETEPGSGLKHREALLDNLGRLFSPPLRREAEDNPQVFAEIQANAAVLGGVASNDLAGAFATVFEQLLELGLGEVLASGWLEDEQMQRLLAVDVESREVILLPLSDHAMTWGYDPVVSLQLGGVGVPVANLRLSVDLDLELSALSLVIQQGHLRELRSGQVRVQLRVTHANRVLINRSTAWLDFEGGLVLGGEGVPITGKALRTAGPDALARLSRAGVTAPETAVSDSPLWNHER